ncbi:MAG: glycosyltransferase family 4 protein [Thermogemmata sp.]|nr:glycosyltransferase family 4 protein [Thermogemmata sp.]
MISSPSIVPKTGARDISNPLSSIDSQLMIADDLIACAASSLHVPDLGQQVKACLSPTATDAGIPGLQQVILCVHRYPPARGGAEAYAARLAAYLQQHSTRVRVWTTAAIQLEDLWYPPAGIPQYIQESRSEAVVERFAPVRGFPGRRWLLKALSFGPHPLWRCLTVPCNPLCPSLWRYAGGYAGPVDAVHALAFPYALLAASAWRLARRRGVPLFLTPFIHFGDRTDPHDTVRRAYTAWHLRWLLRQADGIFVQTAAERDVVLSCGVLPQRVHLQGMGVDPRECTGGDRQRTRRQWNVDDRVTVIGHLANLSWEKGSIDLVEAVDRLYAQGWPCRLVLAGPAMPNFRRYWRTRQGHPAITWLGPLTPEQKRDFYAALDVFALPSRTDSFGLVLLEAWANGLPNVAYQAGGPGELIRHEQDGLLVRCGAVDTLAVQLIRLIRNPNWRQTLGSNGQKRTVSEFRWQEKLELVRQTMQETIQRLRHGAYSIPTAATGTNLV